MKSPDSRIPSKMPHSGAAQREQHIVAGPGILTSPPAASIDGAIHVNLSLPVTRFGVGPLSIDPIARLLGMPLTELLAPLLVRPVFQRASSSGVAIDVYPLALPPGEGVSLRLGRLGDVAFFNDRGLLRLGLPLAMGGWIQQRLAPYIVHGPQRALSIDGTAYIAEVWLQLRPGMRSSLPLGLLGELGIEAA